MGYSENWFLKKNEFKNVISESFKVKKKLHIVIRNLLHIFSAHKKVDLSIFAFVTKEKKLLPVLFLFWWLREKMWKQALR